MLLAESSTTESSSSQEILKETTKNINAVQRFWENIDWDKITAKAITIILTLIILVILFLVLKRVGHKIINHTYKRYAKTSNMSDNRLKTIHTLLSNLYNYTLYFFFLFGVLQTIGVPIGSLLAGAGIVGIAIGLGAQGFMNDIITGIFIILEQQMDVGDYIRFNNLLIEGTVVSVGIRSVQIRSNDGTIHFVPNRNITTISNQSKTKMQVLLDIRIIPDEGIEKISVLIREVNHEIHAQFKEEIVDEPNLFGLVDLGNGNFAIRTTMYVDNGLQYKIKQTFLAAYIEKLTQAGFTIPNTPIVSK